MVKMFHCGHHSSEDVERVIGQGFQEVQSGLPGGQAGPFQYHFRKKGCGEVNTGEVVRRRRVMVH
jgi:hypothetical protein